jgi:hypothetical protein
MEATKNASQNLQISTDQTNFDPSVTFLQIPVSIKDETMAYIAALADKDESIRKAITQGKSPYDAQGCFFVIALERIEELIGILKEGLENVDRDAEKTREQINKALVVLQGQ